MGSIGGEGVVMTIKDGDGSGRDEGLHGGGLLGIDADGEEALPVCLFHGRAGAVVLEAGGGNRDGFDDGGERDVGVVHGGGGRDDGDGLDGISQGGLGGVDVRCEEVWWEELVDGDVLGGENAVQAFEGEGSPAIEKIRDMGLSVACLLGDAGAGESSGFDAAQEFDAKELV